MENASKALLIAGAILLSILIIAIGMFIFTNAKGTITESTSSMSTQERKAFNDQFSDYEGAQTGSSVKGLIGILITNANTYKDEVSKIPTVRFQYRDEKTGKVQIGTNAMTATKPNQANNTSNYFADMGKIRNKVEDKHTYWVEMIFGDGGLVSEVRIFYEKP